MSDPSASTRGRLSSVFGAPMKYVPGAVGFSLNPSDGKGFRPCREAGTESSIVMVDFVSRTISIERWLWMQTGKASAIYLQLVTEHLKNPSSAMASVTFSCAIHIHTWSLDPTRLPVLFVGAAFRAIPATFPIGTSVCMFSAVMVALQHYRPNFQLKVISDMTVQLASDDWSTCACLARCLFFIFFFLRSGGVYGVL